ncbi:DUF3811 domain-containing protein [Undibacterium danionis]|uniref:DUF3811 domain-containing protein n=1 Tax=Undibacterium danionis TaxID=1812100 RepID=A0ABV6IE02_9BURK
MSNRLPSLAWGLMLSLSAFSALTAFGTLSVLAQSEQAAHHQDPPNRGLQNQAPQSIFIELPTAQSLPYYAVKIPLALYPQSANSQLSDLRLRNAKGDYLNYAWLDGTAETLKMESHTLPFFPLTSAEKNQIKDKEIASITVQRQADGSLILQNKMKSTQHANSTAYSWMVDASKLNPGARLVQARVRIDKNFLGIAPIKIEASDDFKHWLLVSELEQLVQLQHQGEQIQQLSLNLHHSKAKYLRLSLLTDTTTDATTDASSNSHSSPAISTELAQRVPQILAITVDTQESEQIAPKMQWTKPIQASHCDAYSCTYQVPANMPIDSLQLHLQEKNTLAKVQIFGEFSKTANSEIDTNTSHHRFRNPLYVLRYQKQLARTTHAQDFFLGDTTAYRLALATGEVNTEALPLSGAALNKIRLHIPAGINSLANLAPTISLGSLSRSLFFLARGETPYRIEFSDNKKEGSPLNLSTLMPQKNLYEQALTFAEVKIPSAMNERNTTPTTKGNSNTIAVKSEAEHASNNQKKSYWLWAALVAAIALISAMVWSLLGNIDKAKADNKDEPR